ncbi:MAG: hypothetical protein QGG36_11485 [Pirellulaceae bacterium]|nr:hypothetical protein [Pirellulaceae bacterium]
MSQRRRYLFFALALLVQFVGIALFSIQMNGTLAFNRIADFAVIGGVGGLAFTLAFWTAFGDGHVIRRQLVCAAVTCVQCLLIWVVYFDFYAQLGERPWVPILGAVSIMVMLATMLLPVRWLARRCIGFSDEIRDAPRPRMTIGRIMLWTFLFSAALGLASLADPAGAAVVVLYGAVLGLFVALVVGPILWAAFAEHHAPVRIAACVGFAAAMSTCEIIIIAVLVNRSGMGVPWWGIVLQFGGVNGGIVVVALFNALLLRSAGYRWRACSDA